MAQSKTPEPKVPDRSDDNEQSERFIEAARKHGADETGKDFTEAFKKATRRWNDLRRPDPTEVKAEIERSTRTKGAMIEDLMLAFENAAHHDDDGAEYWLARELSPTLGYRDFRNFINAVDKAKAACTEVGEQVGDHFVDVTTMMQLGKGAEREGDDIELTRFACYLIAQNGDPTKRPEIAAAQTYFALQTRRQEVSDEVAAQQLSNDQKRVLLRDKLKEHNKLLAEAASDSGVTNFRNFHGAGIKGLYGGLSKAQIVRRKKLPAKSDHLDYARHGELAANYFKATQAEEVLRRSGEIGQRKAEDIHKNVGQAVRDLILEQGNTPPEDDAPGEHIKDVRKRIKSSESAKAIEKK